MLRLTIVVLCVFASARPALAQESAGSVYVFGGITFPHQDGVTGEESVTYVAAPGGTTVGWTVGAGVFASPFVSLEGEVWRTGMMTAREPSRYFTTYNEERRDLFIGGNVRFHVSPRSPVDLEPVVGMCVVRHEGWTTGETVRFIPYQRVEVGERFQKTLPKSLGLIAGADLRIGERRFAIVPSFRLVFRANESTGDFNLTSNYPGGFPKVTFSGGVSARVAF